MSGSSEAMVAACIEGEEAMQTDCLPEGTVRVVTLEEAAAAGIHVHVEGMEEQNQGEQEVQLISEQTSCFVVKMYEYIELSSTNSPLPPSLHPVV